MSTKSPSENYEALLAIVKAAIGVLVDHQASIGTLLEKEDVEEARESQDANDALRDALDNEGLLDDSVKALLIDMRPEVFKKT